MKQNTETIVLNYKCDHNTYKCCRLGHNSVVTWDGTPNSAFSYNIKYLASAAALVTTPLLTPNSAFIYNIEYLVSADTLVTTPL